MFIKEKNDFKLSCTSALRGPKTKMESNRGDFGASPFERAKALVQLILDSFPTCPLCASNRGYGFSGWLHDYLECKNCNARWEVFVRHGHNPQMKLIGSPRGMDASKTIIQTIMGKEMNFESWKKLRSEELQDMPIISSDDVETVCCSDCGSTNNVSNRFCWQCGQTLVKNIHTCPECNESNSIRANFCRKCGSSLLPRDKGNREVTQPNVSLSKVAKRSGKKIDTQNARSHMDQVLALFIRDTIERKEKIDRFSEKYGMKFRPSDRFEDILKKWSIQKD
jgi:ribosomal protein L40E